MSYEYIYKPSTVEHAPTLLLLHGTGGTENDLLDVANFIDPHANILSLRGNEPEGPYNRFFKRHGEGNLDVENLKFHAQDLYNFIDEMAEARGFDRDKVVPIGYSNGANIAGGMLHMFENPFKGAILLHAMVPFETDNMPNLSKTPVFIGAGSNDPIVATSESENLTKALESAGATVTLHWENYGHSLSMPELQAAKGWYASAVG